MNVQNIQSKTYNLKQNHQSKKSTSTIQSEILFADDFCLTSAGYFATLSINNRPTASPSFGGLFSKKNYEDKPYTKKWFTPPIVYENGKIFVNVSKPLALLDVLKSKYFSYDKDYKYEILTKENKKPLTNGQVEMINNILNNKNCINLFNIKDFDYVLKLKDKGFVDACFEQKIQPTKVKPSLINILKKLNETIDEKGKKKYSDLSVNEIEYVNEDNIEFFDKIYNFKSKYKYMIGFDPHNVFLQNIEKANTLIDFMNEIECYLFPDLSCKIVQSEHFDKWMNILKETQKLWETDNKKAGHEYYANYFERLDSAVKSRKYNPIIVDEILKKAKTRNINIHINVLLDNNLAAAIKKKFKSGDENDAIFAMWTGHIPSQKVKLELTKLREKRELTKADYAVFEYAMNNNIESSIVDVIENKPNLAFVVAQYQDTRRVYTREFLSAEESANKAIFNRNNDYTEDETKVLHRLLNEYPVYSSPIIFDCLEKNGYLNDSLFELNYDVSNILYFISKANLWLKDTVDNEIIKKILDLNIHGFNLSLCFFNNADKTLILKRLDLLKEVSVLAPEYMSKINMDATTIQNSCEFIKEALKCGLDDDLIQKGLEFGCGIDGIAKLKLIKEKEPELFRYCLHGDIAELDLATSYAEKNVLKKYNTSVVDFSLFERIPVDDVPDVAELYRQMGISTKEIKKILKLARRNRHELKNLSLKELNEFLIYQLSSSVNETRLGKEILKDGGIKRVVGSIIDKKYFGHNPIKPLTIKSQGEMFNNLSFDKLVKVFEKFDANNYKNQQPFVLSYPRNKFISDLNLICQNYSNKDIKAVMSFLDFPFSLENYFARSNYEYPSDFSIEQKQLCEKLNKQIDKFIYENKVIMTENKEMEKLLNSIIAFLPEFISVIGKKQHGTHKYTVDVHTLKVLQECVNNPEYKNLSAQEQAILNLSVLLHDLGKSEGVVDEGHYKLSAIFAKNIFKKLKINDEMKERIYNLIENHHWLGNLQKGISAVDEIAVAFRSPQDYKLAKIFAQADLKGVSESFYSTCSSALNGKNIKDVEKILDYIHQTNPLLFTSKILPKANINKIDGVKVIDIVNGNDNLTEIFSEDVKSKEDLRFLVHMIGNPNVEKLMNLKALCELGNNTNLSTSLVGYQKNPTYYEYKYGIIIDAPHFNVLMMSQRNKSTGTKKDFYNMIEMLNPYNDKYSADRKKITELLKHEFCVNDKEYAQIYKTISACKKKSQIKNVKVGGRIFKKEEIINALNVFEKSYLNRLNHNEVVVYNPKLSGLVAMIDKYDEVPTDMKEFAKKNDLPIIILGKHEHYK